MALNAYLSLSSDKQGDIEGSVTLPEREGSIMVTAVNHELVTPTDPSSGRLTGKPQHKPFVITKEVDKASPKLYSLLAQGENISKWSLGIWEPDQRGREFQYYTVQLINAKVVGIHLEIPNDRSPENEQLRAGEHVSFFYERIIWTWEDGGITSEDDW